MQIGLSYLWMFSLQNICKSDISWEEIKLQNIPKPGIAACKKQIYGPKWSEPSFNLPTDPQPGCLACQFLTLA